jgi:RimJ/RimL family protein N-acetyltransferase
VRLSPPPCSLPGIILRPLTAADVPGWFAYLSIPEVTEHTSWDLRGPQTLMALVREYESADSRSALRFAIVDGCRAALAGTIGLHSISSADRRGEIAYDLAPPYWGRGIATALCAAVTRWSFESLAMQRVQATVLTTNMRSERVLERCGFTCEGLLRGYRRVRGRPGDFKMFARLAGEPPLA